MKYNLEFSSSVPLVPLRVLTWLPSGEDGRTVPSLQEVLRDNTAAHRGRALEKFASSHGRPLAKNISWTLLPIKCAMNPDASNRATHSRCPTFTLSQATGEGLTCSMIATHRAEIALGGAGDSVSCRGPRGAPGTSAGAGKQLGGLAEERSTWGPFPASLSHPACTPSCRW